MRFINGVFARLLSAAANILVVVIVIVEYWQAGGVVLDKIALYAPKDYIPSAFELHYFDAFVIVVAIWANHHSARAGLNGRFMRWMVDFVPSLIALVVTGTTLAIAGSSLMSGFSWSKMSAVMPIFAFFACALYDILVNQRDNGNIRFGEGSSGSGPVGSESDSTEESGVPLVRADSFAETFAKQLVDLFNNQLVGLLKKAIKQLKEEGVL
jgi:hypothetical protein